MQLLKQPFQGKIRIFFFGLRQISHNYPQFPPEIRLSHPKRLKKQNNPHEASKSTGSR
jgi:hypothetical protein